MFIETTQQFKANLGYYLTSASRLTVLSSLMVSLGMMGLSPYPQPDRSYTWNIRRAILGLVALGSLFIIIPSIIAALILELIGIPLDSSANHFASSTANNFKAKLESYKIYESSSPVHSGVIRAWIYYVIILIGVWSTLGFILFFNLRRLGILVNSLGDYYREFLTTAEDIVELIKTHRKITVEVIPNSDPTDPFALTQTRLEGVETKYLSSRDTNVSIYRPNSTWYAKNSRMLRKINPKLSPETTRVYRLMKYQSCKLPMELIVDFSLGLGDGLGELNSPQIVLYQVVSYTGIFKKHNKVCKLSFSVDDSISLKNLLRCYDIFGLEIGV